MQSSPFNGALPLPEVPLPTDTVCYTVELPNEPRILEAFEGAIQMLSRWPYWARDDAHRGIVAANVFKDLYQALEAGACSMPIQFRQNDICTLQASLDGGVTWDTIFDASTCVTNGVNDGLQGAIDDGRLAPGGQPPSIGTGVPVQCYDYDVQLDANGKWISPVSVSTSDTIEITRQDGGWTDGAGWYCPNGSGYIAGGCFGAGVLDGGDPLPTSPHMSLIGHYGSTFVPAIEHDFPHSITITVAPSTSNEEFTLQANDPSLGDNAGSIRFHVQICKGGWASFLDFQISDYGFLPSTDVAVQSPTPTWVSGQGWLANIQSGFTVWCFLYLDIDSTTITRIGMSEFFEGNSSTHGSATQAAYVDMYSDGHGQLDGDAYHGVHDVIYLPTPAIVTSRIGLVLSAQSDPGNNSYIRSCLVYGTGTKPSQLP